MASTIISPVTPTGGYKIEGVVNGTRVPFLVDTGATVTLLRKDVWDRANPAHQKLEPWSKSRLVGVDGTPLQTHGCTNVTIDVDGRAYQIDVVVVSPLTTEAILGLDFLRTHQASVDLGNGYLTLGDKGHRLPLDGPVATVDVEHVSRVCLSEELRIPPRSEVEVMGCVREPLESGTWLLTGTKRPAAAVAAALVNPEHGQVPVRLLNPRSQAVFIRKGEEIGTLERVEDTPTQHTVVSRVGTEQVSREKQQLLRELVDNNASELSQNEADRFYRLLMDYEDVFAVSNSDLGRTTRLKHTIDTGNAHPIRQPVRRIAPPQRDEVKRLVETMLNDDVIQPSSSPWASPVVLVRKKDGSARFCVDYRKVNEVTHKDAYPLPRIDATLDTLAGSRLFSTLDLLSGYWQVEIAEEDRAKTAFCTTEGLFEFKVMPFGLCNAPATFQRLMDLVLSGVQWWQCLVYLDDVIIIGKDFDEHLRNLEAVFGRLRQAGLKLKPAKCAFLQRKVRYLGYIVSEDGIAPDPAKVEKVAAWPEPKTTREVQQFVGFASYYRRFIQDFASIAKPLYRLTERTNIFNWTAECRTAFNELRRCLTTAPVLAYPDFTREFIVDTDASDTGIGAVLSQVDENGHERVIAYASRVLSKPERRYCVTRRELLAVVVFLREFRPYLTGRHFTLRTDHGSLTWLRNFRDPEGQLARWLEVLQEFDFTIIHRRGRKHTNADALSRLPCRQCGRHNHDEIVPIAVASLGGDLDATLRQAQLDDPVVGPVLRAKETSQEPQPEDVKAMSPHCRRLVQIWDQLVIKDSLLWRQYDSPSGHMTTLQLVVPGSKREEILRDMHEGLISGHLGQEKTLERLKERFYWPGHYMDVRNWCETCPDCAARKNPTQKARAPLQNIKVGCPAQLTAVDIVGPLPESDAGNRYILVVGDYFTRWVEAYAIPNQEAVTVAKKLTDEYFFRFSPPEQLHSDQGRQFESELVAEVCKLLGIHKTRTSPYHPQSDGMIERFNRTMLNMLATAASEHPFDWEEHLRPLCLAYNTSVHATTGYTPFYLMFGRQVRMPLDIVYGTATTETTSPSEYAQALRKRLEEAYNMVRDKTGQQQERQKEYYNRKVHGNPFSEGDLVFLHSPVISRGHARKLHRQWTGPFRVVRRLSTVNYRIQDLRSPRRRLIVHFDRLKPCPSNIRLPGGVPSPQTLPTDRPTSHPSQTPHTVPSRPPPGTHLEVVDMDPPSTRYPRRARRAPDFYSPCT